jgi:hypothetical protein
MHVLAGVLLAALSADPGDLAITLGARPVARSCAIESTATIVAYDAIAAQEIAYRFVHSDGTVSAPGKIAIVGDGAVAQSVRDRWTPHGTGPWVALEIVAPTHLRSRPLAVTARCAHRVVAVTRERRF